MAFIEENDHGPHQETIRGSKTPADPSGPTGGGAGGHAKRRVALSRGRRPKVLAGRRTALPRPHGPSHDAGSARPANAAGGGQDRPSRPHHLPFHGSRPHLEGSGPAA